MGENKREVESEEVDRLLDETMASSGIPRFEEFRPRAVLVDSCNIPYTEKYLKNGSPQQRKVASANVVQNSPKNAAAANEPKLPDEQSLTSAFAELNVADNGLGSQYMRNSGTHRLYADSQIRNPGFHSISEAQIGQENADVFYVDPLRQKNHQVCGSHQHIGNDTNGIPMANSGVQFVPNIPVHPVDLPVENQQQYLMSPQSMHPYLHLPHINQSQTPWRSIEQENFFKLCQQNLYYQQLVNQNFEAQRPVQPYIKSQQFSQYQQELPRQEAILPGYGLSRCLKPRNGTLSPSDARALQTLDRKSHPGFTDKSMTRSNCIGSIQSPKYGTADDTIYHINQNARGAANCQLYHSLCGLNNSKCFREDGPSYCRSYDSRLLPLRYRFADEASNKTRLMAKDQHGCRTLQRKISEGNPQEVEKVFIDIIDHIVELVTDPFGNYLVQKLLEVCNEAQQTRILQVITRNSGDLVRISCNMHGTRVVQKVIETLKTPEQISIVVNSLKPCIVVLMKNSNGNHVAQRCLLCLKPEYNHFLFDAAVDCCVELATDRHGCCVLQKCLNYSRGKQRRRLIHEITSNALALAQDPFGNYAVQFVFDLNIPQATMEIFSQLDGNYADLSMQKYSSNVVEKCLKCSSDEHREHIIQELLGNPRLDQLMQDPYGNYVIQAAVNSSKATPESPLQRAIEANVHMLRTSPYGKMILTGNLNSLKK